MFTINKIPFFNQIFSVNSLPLLPVLGLDPGYLELIFCPHLISLWVFSPSWRSCVWSHLTCSHLDWEIYRSPLLPCWDFPLHLSWGFLSPPFEFDLFFLDPVISLVHTFLFLCLLSHFGSRYLLEVFRYRKDGKDFCIDNLFYLHS